MDFDFESGDGKESESSTSTYTSTIQWSLQPCRVFEFDEILLATDNFNESLVIGSGGFGKVYKGNVNIGTGAGTGTTDDHVVAAIKRLDLTSSNQGAVEFWAEVEILSKLRHAHLVSLIGYCNYEREMILIYEYMPHGTLEDHLHKLRTPLSWVERLKICIGAARGLDYLHTGTGIDLGVIHRDVKSSNILLHDSWAAKISDFGLSRIGPTNQPLTYVNTLVKGTFGYLDPNYFATGKLTRKSDVYAFGVVLFELLCQKRPVDKNLEWGLATWAQDSIKEGNLKNIIDPDIRGEISSKSLKEFAQIAQRCLDSHPKHRPTMTEVVFSLQSVLAIQQKTNNLLQTSGKTVFERVVDVFPFGSIGENSGVFGFLTLKKRKQLMLRKKFVLRLDKLRYLSADSSADSMKLFRVKELDEATQNYASNMIIGRGGFGTVYKGILRDNHVIAIKRSQRIDDTQFDQFLNELAILGQINHKHVVQLLGCCLEAEVPLLVYEFVSNGTLYHHIHNVNSTNRRLSWGSRLKIAHESALALAYLHTDTRMSIIHRDVKSSNILLYEKLTAKITDFGLSKLVPLDHDRDAIATAVAGTIGYLDPEYFHTDQLTVKSDVYSFGVVLAELLTGRKPLNKMAIATEERNLAAYFVKTTRENRTFEIVDHQLFEEATGEQLEAACDLACRCLELIGLYRPSMKEVAMELETIRIGSEQADHDDYSLIANGESEQVDLYDVSLPSIPFLPYHGQLGWNPCDTFISGEYSSSTERNQE